MAALRIAAATLAATVTLATPAFAAAPLSIVKTFGKPIAHVGDDVRLTYTIANTNPPGGFPVADIGFSDHLPAGLVVSVGSSPRSTCGGSTGYGGGNVTLAHGDDLPAGAVCSVALDVHGTSPGVKVSGTTVTSGATNGGTTSASLLVVATPPLTGGPAVTEYVAGVTPGFTGDGAVNGIAAGADGNIWFAESGSNGTSVFGRGAIARLDLADGHVTEHPAGTTSGFTAQRLPQDVTTGPDGRIWFAELRDPGAIARLEDDGSVTELTGGLTPGFTADQSPERVVAGTDGELWFNEVDSNALGRVNADGTVSETTGLWADVAAGTDGGMWATRSSPSALVRFDADGSTRTISAETTPGFMFASTPYQVTAGPDGRIWFGDRGAIGRLNDDGTATEFVGGETPGFAPFTFPQRMTAGPDGNVWFTTDRGVARLNPDGSASQFRLDGTPGLSRSGASYITTGPDGNVWFAESDVPGSIARIAPQTPGADTGTAATATVAGAEQLTGTVNPAGLEVTECRFEYTVAGAQPEDVPCAERPGAGRSTVRVSARATGLRPASLYSFRLIAGNAAATNASLPDSFTTPSTPSVATGAASDVGARVATLHGTLDPDGAHGVDCRFEYGPSDAYGSLAPCAENPGGASSPVAVSARLAGLRPGTTYHFRLAGTTFATRRGADATFTTAPGPAVVTGAATAVGASTATLRGTVDPNRVPVRDCRFEYGPSRAYGAVAPCAEQVGGGPDPVAVSATLRGLRPATAYHFRLVATNAVDTSAGGDRIFATGASRGDARAPVISSVRVRPKAFAAGHGRRRGGTRFAYTLSERARVVFTIARLRHARAKRVGRVTARGVRGRNRLRFWGRLHHRTLATGRYRATLVAIDAAGNRSAPRRVRFRIVSP